MLMKDFKPVLVSACLLGLPTRYDGKSVDNITDFLSKLGYFPIPFCPEQLIGFSTPRFPMEIENGDAKKFFKENGKIFDVSGKDLSLLVRRKLADLENFVKKFPFKRAILKDKSPFCGVKKVYDGSFSSKLVEGFGLFSYILMINNFEVKVYEEIQDSPLLFER